MRKLDTDCKGKSVWRLYKTPAARKAAMSRLLKLYPHYNYYVWWLDVNGYGMQACVAKWVEPGRIYFNP